MRKDILVAYFVFRVGKEAMDNYGHRRKEGAVNTFFKGIITNTNALSILAYS